MLSPLGVIFLSGASALATGVGKLPTLGFNTWNVYQCNYNADILLAQGRAMVDTGLLKAGYDILMLDDCYSLRQRDANGRIVADPKKFPYGMKNFTDSLQLLGLRAGIYGDAGYQTCAGYPGSYGHEEQDLQTWSEWGFHYLKYDNCYIPFDNVTQENVYGRYKRMANAIEAHTAETLQPFQLALCEWGWQSPWVWAGRLGQSWRIGGDIRPWWSALSAIINQASFIATETRFYARNDLDMLEVGNTNQGTPPGNLTLDEAKSHFTAWALLKSPLLIGSDLTTASRETVQILGNTDILRISQDPLVGESIAPFRWGKGVPDYTWDPVHPAAYWTGNSSYGVVFMVLNTLDTPQLMSFNLTESWAIRAGRVYSVYDMWSHTHNGTALRNISVTLPPHGVSALLLTDAGPEPSGMEPFCAGYWQCSYPNGTYYSN